MSDVYYILFRHKWLIAILSAVSVAAALVVRSQCPVPYQSEAKLMIKYVKDNRPPEGIGPDALANRDVQGENAVNSEIEVMTSADLATNVVDVLGASRILAKAGGGSNRTAAINLVKSGFMAVANRSDVVQLIYLHPDPEMVQPILSALIDAYIKKHHEIHQGPGFVDFLQKQKEEAQTRISELDKQILDLKHQAGITINDVHDSVRLSGDLENKILGQKLDAEAEYAAYQETIREIENTLPKPASVAKSTNSAGASNNVVAVPASKAAEYQRICRQLTSLQAQQQAMIDAGFTENTSLYRTKQTQIDQDEAVKEQLEAKYPSLMVTRLAASGADPQIALREVKVKAEALAAKIKILAYQLSQTETNAALMTGYEGPISQLQRDKNLAVEEESFYSRRLDEARVAEEVGSGTNISPVESPTAPSRTLSKFNKIIAEVLLGGLAFAFGLPFLIELVLDRSLKRANDVQARLGLPFFMSIPRVNGTSRSRALKKVKAVPLLPGKTDTTADAGSATPSPAAPTNGHLALWQMNDGLQPFYEALRDRLVTYLDALNLTHKPKLVAVTSCAAGAGVTNTAAGLASSLSETGDGNVLLVNMNVRDGEAHHFYKGKLTCALEEVFEKGARESALVHDHLYVAKDQPEDDRLPRVLPKRFSHLLPKMRASDFDYIIFDMPPVSQISVTSRLARFMDMVLLVVESGKTDRDVATRAAAVLAETKTQVGVVLNKHRSYGPRSQHHDI